MIQPQLFVASCDVVILLDCCFAGQAVRARTAPNVELLAATDKDQFTPTGTGLSPSFTKILMREMKAMMAADGLVTLPALQRRMAEHRAGLKKQPFHVSLTADKEAGAIKLSRLGNPGAGDNTVEAAISFNSIYLKLSLFDDVDLTSLSSLVRWLTKDSPTSIRNIQLVDQTLSDAREATDLTKSLLEGGLQSTGKFLHLLSEQGQQEIHRLFSDLKSALSEPGHDQLPTPDITSVVKDIKERSNKLVDFVSDSLAAMDRTSLEALRITPSAASLQDLRSRIAMRLTLIDDDPSGDSIRVDFGDTASADQRLRRGNRRGDPVLVEYVYYDASDGDAHQSMWRQVSRVSALHLEPKSSAFRMLQGLGFSHETLCGPRFGFIYALPQELKERMYSPLSDLVMQVKTVPLDMRIQLASSICDAVLHFHSIGWYHKNLNSDNIILFAAADGANELTSAYWDWSNPYLIGFDCSRPSDAETRHTIDFSAKNNIYRHPDRWGRPVRFEKHHDLYALVRILCLHHHLLLLLPVAV